MKSFHLFTYSLYAFLIALPFMANASDYCRLYAVNDKNAKDSEFFTISPESFKIKTLGEKYQGQDFEALDVHPLSKKLYVASSDKSTEPGHLYTVHKLTGELEKIGDTGFADIEGLSFHPDGTLWGWAKKDGFIKIDAKTAKSELVLANNAEVEDLTWNNDGSQIYAVEDTNLWVSDGQSAELACNNLPGHTEAIEMLPDGNLLLGIHGNKGMTRFQSLNPVTCEQTADITILTEDYDDIEGIAWACQPQVYLLLHGMNSDEKTWDKLIDSKFDGICGTVENGKWTMTDKNHPALDPNDYECYRIRFGTPEYGSVGLEEEFFWEKGDGSTFEQLGIEVNKAVEEIVDIHSKNIPVVITLVAHSRGGLAARAFLQNPEYPLRSEISGLLTIGTPHQGSPFGRIYQWLEDNPRLLNPPKECTNYKVVPDYCPDVKQRIKDWDAVDFLRGLPKLDLRKPTIDFLTDNSTEITQLNANVQQLSKNIVYAEMISVNVPFGNLKGGVVSYEVWPKNESNIIRKHPSDAARNYILNGVSKEQKDIVYNGDGIVPENSQRMSSIPGFLAEVIQLPPLVGIHHIDETKQVAEIEAALRAMQAGELIE